MKPHTRTLIFLTLALVLMILLMFEHNSYGYEICDYTYPKDSQMKEFCTTIQDNYVQALKMYVLLTNNQTLVKSCMTISAIQEDTNLIIDWQQVWMCIELAESGR